MAREKEVRLALDAAVLEERGRFRQVRFRPRENAFVLDDMELVEDDAPAIGRPEGAEERSWFEKLHRGVMIRKVLVLDDPRALAAFLLFDGTEADYNEAPLHIRINGHELVRPPSQVATPFARHYYTPDWGGSHFDNWFVIPVPVGALRQGENEVVLWAESEETSWEVMVAADGEYARGSETRLRHPDRSARSLDGGQTWDAEHLGWKGEIDGEYCIRLSLDRYAGEGVYSSPVIDLAGDGEGIAAQVEIEECCLAWEADSPEGCRVEIRVCFGDVPVPGDTSWSAWEVVAGCAGTWKRPAGRYLQFEVGMGAEDRLVTPVLRGVSAISKIAEKERESSVHCRVLESRNSRVVRPSVEFVHEDFARLGELRQRFGLDEVVKGASSEFEAQVRLLEWAYKVPIDRLDPYAWNYCDLPRLEVDAEGRPILQGDYGERGRRRDGHCLLCNLTLIAACLAMGYPARWVNISTKHTYGHEVAEVWSNDFDKWIFLDATRDYYAYDPDTGVPLSLVELSERLGEIMPAPATWDLPLQHHLDEVMAASARVGYRQGKGEVCIADPSEGPEHLLLKGHLQMPLRNDFASRPHPVPWRVSSNWGSDLLYCFYGEMFPRKREYPRHTDRWQDFCPPLNQAELFLRETAEPGVLRADVDTETPCFETFLVRVDDGGWKENPQAWLEWRLHEGLNRLRVKVRNSAGVCGPESRVAVVMNS